jgi:hypothetical protein
MVSPFMSAPFGGPVREARRGSKLAHFDSACDADSNLSRGTFAKRGSALYRKRSAYASFFASMRVCQYCGFVGPAAR